jgi:hypothetical protein
MHVLLTAILISALAPVRDANATEVVNEIAKLYADAFYDQALTLAARASGDSATPASELQPLRTFKLLCEVALGRDAEAGQTAEEIVRVEPLPAANEADLPPQIRKMLADIRAKVVPDIVRDRYQRGRARLDRSEYGDALADFEFVISLVDNAPLTPTSQAALADMRLLAVGFRDLTRTKASARAAAPAPEPSAGAVAPRAVVTARPPRIVQPQVLRQELPHFVTSHGTAAASPPFQQGILEFTIGKDGTVTAARMITPINPVYDAMVSRAARQWKYRPALADGVPIEVVKTLTINVGAQK